MSIELIAFVTLVVLGAAIKLHRGTFFRWSKKDAPSTRLDQRDSHDHR